MIKAGITVSLLIVAAALAEPPARAPRPNGPNNDPDQIVCVKQKEIGSRLTTRRICRTRAEWAEHRSQTRQVVERVQANKPTCNNGPCVEGGPF